MYSNTNFKSASCIKVQNDHFYTFCSFIQLSLKVRTLQVLVEREEGPSQSVSPAISLILGSHDTTAVSLNVAEWSGKVCVLVQLESS